MTTASPDSPPRDPLPKEPHLMPTTRVAVRGVAIFEAVKGLIVLLVGFDLLRPMWRELGFSGDELVRHMHLNPASRIPHIFVDVTSRFEGMSLMPVALGALGYALVRFVEAYGLWRQRTWAEWFAAASGGIYIPFEIRHLIIHEHHRLLTALILAANIVIVLVMARALRRRGAIHA